MKKEDFVIGRWYKSTRGNGEYRKCAKLPTGDSLPYSDKIYEYKYSSNFNSHFQGLLDLKEIPLSEIQQYLPDNHPDKINSYEIY